MHYPKYAFSKNGKDTIVAVVSIIVVKFCLQLLYLITYKLFIYSV